ncbi:unnamed protein product [Lepeophtheirus salmonis]|uniref:(salmon louse) hypothetical protein n=1 Tax=Lepeophtheirus salmonis TaxID=72036 RepID=A0A7R8CQC1_LEPSM|nr:unnamed protein product [Lepeophtheirus salmonis]CAF2894254.1 unnamed protein product [Lepeophtheirus salmonis]
MLGVHSWENMDYDNFQSPISELGSGPRSSSPLLHVGGNEIMKNKKSDLMVLCGTHLFRAIRVACAGSFQKRSQGHFEFNENNEYPNSPIFERLRDVALLRNMYKRGGASDLGEAVPWQGFETDEPNEEEEEWDNGGILGRTSRSAPRIKVKLCGFYLFSALRVACLSLLSQRSAGNFGNSHHGVTKRAGLSDQCCAHPCSFETLLSFC